MELAGLFLLVLMPPADATGETAEALTAALHAELGDVTMVLAPDTLVTPAMWKGEHASMRARFVAHVLATDQNEVTVDVVANGDAPKRAQFHESRKLTFSAADSKAERGRAIALVLAELLRESPVAALIAPHPPGGGLASASRLALAGLFAAERVLPGSWGLGPEVMVGFGITDAFWVRGRGRALFGSADFQYQANNDGVTRLATTTDQYNSIGVGLEAVWMFLRSEHNRHTLGIGLGADVLHESASVAGEHGQSVSGWNVALVPSLTGSATILRRLRLVGSIDARFLPTASTVALRGDNNGQIVKSFTNSKFRPAFALGLELAL
jgi:hypothetical protein